MRESGGRGGPVRVFVGGAGRYVVVMVDPPESGPPRKRTFLVPPLVPGGQETPIEASVLYTVGRTEDRGTASGPTGTAALGSPGASGLRWDDEEENTAEEAEPWFVKAYQCRTPEEARLLHQHFLRQATDINQANGEIAGPRLEPPWAMAPVYVVRADGAANHQGRISTHLGAAAETLVLNADGRIWEWFDSSHEPQRGNYFMVLSRQLNNPMVTVRERPRPGTEELRHLLPMAKGLDVCHRAGIAHCDIKPDNVRIHYVDATPHYVLIDSDAVTRLNSAPLSLRCTQPYVLPELVRRFTDPALKWARSPLTATELRAHDRYAFALVTVAAVAGEAALGELVTLHQHHEGAETDPLDPEAAVAELERVWGDPRWRPLARVLGSVFSSQVLRSEQWSAEAWIQEAIQVAWVESGSTTAVLGGADDPGDPPVTGWGTGSGNPGHRGAGTRETGTWSVAGWGALGRGGAGEPPSVADEVRHRLPQPLRRDESAREVIRVTDEVVIGRARQAATRSFAFYFGLMAAAGVAILAFLVVSG